MLLELRASDLRFTPDEAAFVGEVMGLTLSANAVAELVERTEGWIAVACNLPRLPCSGTLITRHFWRL